MAILVPQVADTSAPPPDVIYHHGVVLTMEHQLPRTEAVALRAVLPGFIDSHAHWIGDGGMVGYDDDLAIDAALRRGWTSINEQLVDRERLETLRSLDAAGQLRLRVNAYLPVTTRTSSSAPGHGQVRRSGGPVGRPDDRRD